MKIDHIGIAVKSISDALKVYEKTLGLKAASCDEVDEQGVRVALLPIGESGIELLEPTRPDSPIEKFLSKRGEGIHHIAVRVDNLEEALERIKASGVRVIDSMPRRGAYGTRVAFIHPSSTHGVLLELVEHAE